MEVDHSRWKFEAAGPPDGLSDPVAALWWLGKGDWQLGEAWETAHELCQRAEGAQAHDWVHALAHWIEGDAPNAGYWYRRCGQERSSADAREEWTYILERIE